MLGKKDKESIEQGQLVFSSLRDRDIFEES